MKGFAALSLATAGLAAAFPRRAPNAAVYFLDNNPDGSSVVALKAGPNGTVYDPVRTSTHGSGFHIIGNAALPTFSDSLMSADPIIVRGDYLFTLNSASNTLAAFKIDPADPQKLTLIGDAVDTMGDFPVSVDYSENLRTACVFNGGTPAGVSCFNFNERTGLTPTDNTLRSIQPFTQTQPPDIDNQSASQIIFTPDNSGVVALNKGAPGAFHTFGINHGKVSTEQINYNQTDFGKPFGGSWIDSTHFFFVDPTFGASVLEYNPKTHGFSEIQHTEVPDQGVMCWSAYADAVKTAYGADGGKGAIYTFDSEGKRIGTIDVEVPGAKMQGVFDIAIDHTSTRMYALVGTPPVGVATIDLEENKLVQYSSVNGLGNSTGWTGMTVYPNTGRASF